MKRNFNRRSRCLVFLLIVLLVVTMMPVSAFYGIGGTAEAEDSNADVTVLWKPGSDSIETGKTGRIELKAVLNSIEERDIQSAEVKISLTEAEAELLTDFQDKEQIDIGNGVTISLTEDGSGYSLSFALTKDDSPEFTYTLSVSAPSKTTAPFIFEVAEEDIQVTALDAAGDPINDANISKAGGQLSFTADCSWQASLGGDDTLAIGDSGVPNFSYTFDVTSGASGETGVLYTDSQSIQFTLTLPDGISLPAELTASDNRIVSGTDPVAEFTGLPEGAVIESVSVQGQQMIITVCRERAAEDDYEQELSDIDDGTIFFYGGSLSASEDMVIGADTKITLDMKVTSTPADGGENVEVEAKPRSIQVTAAESQPAEGIDINQYREAFEQTIFWIDNNNEASLRPSESSYPVKLYFSLDGSDYTELTEENMTQLGLDTMPEVEIIDNGSGSYTYSAGENTLPVEITETDEYGDQKTHTISWRFEPQQVDGYELVEVTDANIDTYPSVSRTGWYYVLLTDFTFDVQLRWGTLGSAPGISQAIYDNFDLHVSVTGQEEQIYNLNSIKESIDVTADSSSDPDNPTSGSMTIHDTWKYNLDGSLISYTVEEVEDGDGKIETENLQDGDYFKISYDNTSAPNFGSVTDKIHNGGTLYLTLSGKKDYQSKKVWLDDGSDETVEKRPTGELQLWRYRSGQNYSTASPVYDENGDFITISLDTTKDEMDIIFNSLEKYDAEGYEYIYVVKEYLDSTAEDGSDAADYEQVFGAVDEDGTVHDRLDVDGKLTNTTDQSLRADLDNCLYNGGTLSNRIDGDVNTEVTNVWKAAAFQADFENVKVVLSLQSRPAGTDAEWKDTGETVTMEDFYSEQLSDSYQLTVSRYDHLGREVEYRWIESGVYQENSDENLLTADGNGGGTFTLNQNDREVQYKSQSTEQEDGSTLITNSIANTVDYDIVKKWVDEDGNDISQEKTRSEVKFYLFRTVNGTDMVKVAEVTMDGETDEDQILVNEELGIYFQETESWKATITPLEEFDEEGRQYEYSLVEVGGNPSMETSKDEDGNYTTEVTNGPGTGNWIVVRKEWVDHSDVIHRQPVTVTVYERDTDKEITEVTLGENDIWYDWVSIGEYEPEEVYILETQVGDTIVPFEDGGDSPSKPKEYDGENSDDYTEVQFKTDYHTYAATYSSGTIEETDVKFYRVSNRRLGNIDLTVEKTWTDGDGENREELVKAAATAGISLVMRLDFDDSTQQQDYYNISYDGWNNDAKGDSVNIGNIDNRVQIMNGSEETAENVDAMQAVDLAKDTSTYSFFNLPKYDRTGNSVRYKVEEVWVDKNGEIISTAELKGNYPDVYELYKEYSTSYETTSYNVGDLHDADTHRIEVENKLTGTKSVLWHKQWNDDYIYNQGQRPDIYLNIYQTRHTSEDPDSTETTLYEANYKWTFSSAADDPDGLYSRQYHWHAELENLPKYDEYGYEIIYYATEHMDVNSGDFDYQDTGYAVPKENGTAGETESIGTEFKINEGAEDFVQEVSQLSESDAEEHYALKEGGTFVNSISSNVTVQGQKLWTSLPSGYPDADLPTVTFGLYQSLANDTAEKGTQVATLTVSDWADVHLNGSYLFRIEYTGENVMTVKNGEVEVVPADDNQNAQKLPKYDQQGRLYTYTLEEINVDTEEEVDSKLVFTDSVTNTYLVNNIYDSVKGALSVKKILELPLDESGRPEAYPAVTFELTRTYTTSNGQKSEPEVADRITWTSEEIRELYNSSDEPGSMGVSKTFTFDDLDIYAPNGSEYTYTVKEVKTELGGYDTWAVPKDVLIYNDKGKEYKTEENRRDTVTNLNLTCNKDEGRGETADNVKVAATFINAPQNGQETVTLSGDKLWDDYGNEFDLRPDDIELTVSRYAESQTGQSNPVEEETVSEEKYEVTWVEDSDSDKWTYTIKGTAESGELERYAPNGMPWKYVITEKLSDDSDYHSSPSSGRVEQKNTDTGDQGTTITMNPLTNSITTSVPYSKTWVDREGNIITGDYLNLGRLNVDFKLQVKGEDGQWTDAEQYFKDNLTEETYNKLFGSYSFTNTLSGLLGDTSVWGVTNYFRNLPEVIKVKDTGGEKVKLSYRVVETKISYGSVEIGILVVDKGDGTYTYEFTVETLFSPAYWADGKDKEETQFNCDETREMYNRLKTTSLEIAKVWEGDNHNVYNTRPDTGRDGYTWETSFVIQRSNDGGASWENVTVYNASGVGQDLVVTLYGTDRDDRVETTVAGLPESDDQGKTYTYRAKELQPGYQLSGGKVGAADIVEDNGNYNDTYTATYEYDQNSTEVTNRLETREITAQKSWKPDNYQVPEGTEVILHLQYKDGNSWITLASVTLDGTADTGQTLPYYEEESWKAVWKDLPQRIPGQSGNAEYRVIEEAMSGYMQEITDDGNGNFTITNTVSTTYAVKKIWGGVPASEQGDVVVGLYRTVDANIEPKPVIGEDGDQVTLTLTAADNWQNVFNGLEKFDEEGREYIYSVKELTIGGVPAEDCGFIIDITEDENGTAVIVNIDTTEVNGLKTWKDNGNIYNTRPSDLELTLYRSAGGGEEEIVDVEPTWTKNGDVWSYEYTGLPETDSQGRLYTYRVEETVPDGYAGTQNGNNFVNTLSESIDIPVKKIWEDNDNAAGKRPSEIVIILYANGVECDRVTLSEDGGILQKALELLSGNTDNIWEYVFEDLPKYDEDGALIEYTIEEESVPGDYEAEYNGYTIYNRMNGGLTVSKTVGGDAGDKDKAFHFTVTLSDKTINGTYGDLEFVDGVAEFTLKHGEKASSSGLPAGVTYTVIETEANQDGYITSSVGATGAIPAGDMANASFTNSKYTPSARYGNLTVSKTVGGDAGDKDKAFHFTVTLSDKTVNGTYGDMEFVDGVAEFTLKHGETADASGLPAGVTYTVTEEEADQDGYTTSSVGDRGTIPVSGTAQAAFSNYKDDTPDKTGSLSVSKTVSGDAGNEDEVFHFTVTLSDKTVNGTYGDMEFVDGVAELSLKHGETADASGLPAGITYTVTEAEANQDGYTTTAEGETGVIESGSRAEASFINHKDGESVEPDNPDDPDQPVNPDEPDSSDNIENPQTGDTTNITSYIVLLFTAVAALLVTLLILRLEKRRKDR